MKTPSEQLAERIMTRFVQEGILTADQVKSMQPKLAAGALRPQDWRLPIETTLERGASK